MHRIGVSGKGEKPLYRFDIRKAAEKLLVSQPLCAFKEMLLSERRLKDDAVFDAAFRSALNQGSNLILRKSGAIYHDCQLLAGKLLIYSGTGSFNGIVEVSGWVRD